MMGKIKNIFKSFKLPSTSKLILWGAVLLCLQIILFCEYMMLYTGDTSSMYVLIGIPATLVPVILGYFNKSKAENTTGGIVYETVMLSKQKEEIIDDEDAQG